MMKENKNSDDIPRGVQEGSQYGDLCRQISESIHSYLNGDKNSLSRALYLSRQREELLGGKKNEDID